MAEPKRDERQTAWNLAALRLAVKLVRLRLFLLKAGYQPDQPRIPAGSPTGGQWTGPGVNTDRIHVAVSAYDNPGLYYVDLAKEEGRGGHGYSKHVARSNTQLIAYQWQQRIENPGTLHPAEGSFNSLGEANNLVSQVLRSNAETVQRVIDGHVSHATLLQRFDFPTGREAFSPDSTSPFVIRPTFLVRVLIRQHSSRPG